MEKNQKYQSFVLIPEELIVKLVEMTEKIKKIEEVLDNKQQSTLGGFITEAEAKNLLGRKTTWFWNARKSGILKGRKVANRWYYKTDELLKLMEGGVN